MKVSYEDHGAITVLTMSGGLTADQQDSFRRTCEDRFEAGVRDVVLDLEHVTHVDSIGLEMLLWLQDEVAGRMGHLKLVRPDETVRTVLTVTRLEGRFDLHDSIESAAKSLRA